MKRREFCIASGTLGLLCAASPVAKAAMGTPSSPDEHLHEQPGVAVIGIGGFGVRQVSWLKGNRDVGFKGKLIAVDIDDKSLSASVADKKYRLKSVGYLPHMFKDPPSARATYYQNLFLAHRPLLESELKGISHLLLVAGLRNGAGNYLTMHLAELAQSMGIETWAALTLPFGFERFNVPAQSSFIAISKHVRYVLRVSLDELGFELGEDTPIRDVFEESDKAVRRRMVAFSAWHGSGHLV